MNLRDLRYLVAVARHRHFGRAAESCHVSQPTLSAQLKKLEEYLGVMLVERTNKQVMLTPIGEEVAARARSILAAADDLVEVARAAGDPLGGDFRLSLIPTVAPYLLPHLVPEIRERLPRLRPSLYEDQTAQLLDRLRRGEVDAGILALPVEGADSFAREHLYDEPFLLATPADHRLADAHAVHLDQLSGEPVLLLEEGHCLRDQALAVCKLVGAGEEREFRATSLETLRQMVAAGGGITLLPELAAAANASLANASAVTLHRFSGEPPLRHIAMVWRKGSPREPAVKALAEAIRDLDVIRALNSGQPVD